MTMSTMAYETGNVGVVEGAFLPIRFLRVCPETPGIASFAKALWK
jgi:hypothetical protein